MPLYTLDVRSTVPSVRYEIAYTLGRLRAHSRTAALAPPFETLLAKCSDVAAREQSLDDAVVFARAQVDAADDALDAFVDVVVDAIAKQNDDDRTTLTRTLLAGKRPSAIKRPILGSELELVRGWSTLLAASPTASIAELAPRCDAVVNVADSAVSTLSSAELALRSFRVLSERPALVNEANLARKKAYGLLHQMPHQNGNRDLPTDFADQFFLHSSAPATATQTELRAEITEKEEELVDLRKKLAALEAREAEMQAAEAARVAARNELEQAEEAAAQAAARVAELRAKSAKR